MLSNAFFLFKTISSCKKLSPAFLPNHSEHSKQQAISCWQRTIYKRLGCNWIDVNIVLVRIMLILPAQCRGMLHNLRPGHSC